MGLANHKNFVLIISGASGVGKTTISQELLKKDAQIERAITTTTRLRRKSEKEGRDYFFVTPEQFAFLRKNNQLLEWAEVHNNLYGTPKASVEKILAQGKDVLLTIDVVGALNVREKIEDSVLVFIKAPSDRELEKRLTLRGQDDQEAKKIRIKNAAKEQAQAVNYDYIVINDNFDTAVAEVYAILCAERCRVKRLTNI